MSGGSIAGFRTATCTAEIANDVRNCGEPPRIWNICESPDEIRPLLINYPRRVARQRYTPAVQWLAPLIHRVAAACLNL